jgi:hypothetical protein
MACARCGAPIAAQNPMAADRAAGESGYAAVPADLLRQPPPKSRPPKSRLPGASWLAIGGGIAVVLGSFLPWILVYVYDGNLFNDPNDPNLFTSVPVSNSISGGARAASAVFGLILVGFAVAIKSASARGVFVKPRAYAYGIPLIALSVLGFAGCGVFAVAGDRGFREANGLGLVGYRIFTVAEKHPVRALDGTVGSAHVSFVPNVGLVVILLGCVAAVIGAIGSLYYASPRRRPSRHEYQPGGMTAGSGEETTHTFRFDRGRHIAMGIVWSIFSVASLGFAVFSGLAYLSQTGLWTETLAIVFGLGAGWLAICRFRMGVQVSGKKLAIRNEQRIYTVDAADIHAITLQKKKFNYYEWWVAKVELTSGKDICIDNFSCGTTRNPPRPERVAIVEQVRALLGVRAENVGQP